MRPNSGITCLAPFFGGMAKALGKGVEAVFSGRAAAVSAGLLIGTVFCAKYPVAIDSFLMPRFVAFAAGVEVLLVGLIVILKRRKELVDLSIVRRAVFPLWIAFLVSVGISASAATNPSEALFEWLKAAVFLAYFGALALLLSRNKEGVALLTGVISLVCLVLGAIGLVQYGQVLHTHGLDLETTYRVRGISGHRNLFSQTLLLTAPFAAYGMIVARGLWRTVCAIAVLLALVLATALMVRSVWVAAIAAGVATGALLVLTLNRETSWRLMRHFGVALAVGGVLVAATVLLGSRWGGAATFTSQLKGITSFNEGSAVPRLFLWRNTWRMVLDHPVLGVGAGNWIIVFPLYAGGSELTQGGWRPPQRPHNDYLWVLAETGAVGLCLYLAMFLTILWSAARVVRTSPDRKERVLAALMFFALVGYLVFSMFSFPRERIEHSMLLSLIFVVIVVMQHGMRPPLRTVPRPVVLKFVVVASVVVAMATVLGAKRTVCEVHTMRAYGEWMAKNYDAVDEEITQAYSPLTTVDRCAFPLLYYRGTALAKLGWNERAHDDLRKAHHDSPYNAVVVRALAVSWAERGDYDEAERLFTKALEIHPRHPSAVVNLAILHVRNGRDEEALEVLRQCDPSSEDRRYFRVLMPLLRHKAEQLGTMIGDERVKAVLQRKARSDDWLRAMYRRAGGNAKTFDDEVLSALLSSE